MQMCSNKRNKQEEDAWWGEVMETERQMCNTGWHNEEKETTDLWDDS